MEENKFSLNSLFVGLYTDTRVPNECRYILLKPTPTHQTLQVNKYLKQTCNTDKIYPCYQPIDKDSRILIDGLESDKFFERLSSTTTWTDFANKNKDTIQKVVPEDKVITLSEAMILMDTINDLLRQLKAEEYVAELNEKLKSSNSSQEM